MMTLKEPSLEIDVTLGTFISVEMVFYISYLQNVATN